MCKQESAWERGAAPLRSACVPVSQASRACLLRIPGRGMALPGGHHTFQSSSKLNDLHLSLLFLFCIYIFDTYLHRTTSMCRHVTRVPAGSQTT